MPTPAEIERYRRQASMLRASVETAVTGRLREMNSEVPGDIHPDVLQRVLALQQICDPL